MISFSSILYFAEWIVRVLALFVVVRKRRPTAALAWLVVIYFQPGIGIAGLPTGGGWIRLDWRMKRSGLIEK